MNTVFCVKLYTMSTNNGCNGDYRTSFSPFFWRNINKKNLSWEVIYIHLVLSGSVEKVRSGLKLYNNQLPKKKISLNKKSRFPLTFASFKFPNLKCSAPTLFKISGGTSAFTFSLRSRDAVPYACKAA